LLKLELFILMPKVDLKLSQSELKPERAMNNFYELFTIEGDSDLFYVFRFDQRNKFFDDLPSHLSKKLVTTFDFTDCPSTSDEFADEEWDAHILITVVFDLLNELKNQFDVDGKITDLILDSNRKTNGRTLAPLTLVELSSEPYVYVFKNLSEQECFQLILIDGNCRLNTFRASQASDAKILRDCVWNLMCALGVRDSFYKYYSNDELKEFGIQDNDIQKYHRDRVKKNIGSYVSDSLETWVIINGLNSVRKYEEGFSLSDSELREILELIILIKINVSEIFKKKFKLCVSVFS
jgi:hypothetical protein